MKEYKKNDITIQYKVEGNIFHCIVLYKDKSKEFKEKIPENYNLNIGWCLEQMYLYGINILKED